MPYRQNALASECPSGARTRPHVAVTTLPHPLFNPARALAEGGHQMLGLCGPLQGPTEKGATPTPNPTALKFFTLPRIQKFSFLPLFYCIVIKIVLPPLSYKRLTPLQQMGICCPLSLFCSDRNYW